jgi:hypothetical protein
MQAESASESPPAEPMPEVKPARGRKPEPRKRSLIGRIAIAACWLLFVMTLGVLAAAAYKSDTVVEELPETKPVFEALGFDLPKPSVYLKITDVTAARVEIERVPALVIEGKVTNTADGRRTVPPLRGSLRDDGDTEVYAWTFTVSASRLGAGESATFRTEVRQPSPRAKGMSVDFVNQN